MRQLWHLASPSICCLAVGICVGGMVAFTEVCPSYAAEGTTGWVRAPPQQNSTKQSLSHFDETLHNALRRAASPAERALWVYLARGQMGAKFSRQMPVGPFFADFLCRQLALVIELDGHSHDIDSERDVRRDRWLREHGYTVLHFTNEDALQDTEAVAIAIHEEGYEPGIGWGRSGIRHYGNAGDVERATAIALAGEGHAHAAGEV